MIRKTRQKFGEETYIGQIIQRNLFVQMLFRNGESQKDFKNLQKFSSTSSEHSVATITEIHEENL